MSQFHNDKLHVAALQETGSLPDASQVPHGFPEDLSQIPRLNKRSKKATLILGDLNMDRKRARKTVSAHGFNVSSPSAPTHQGGKVMDIETRFTSSDHGTAQGAFKP